MPIQFLVVMHSTRQRVPTGTHDPLKFTGQCAHKCVYMTKQAPSAVQGAGQAQSVAKVLEEGGGLLGHGTFELPPIYPFFTILTHFHPFLFHVFCHRWMLDYDEGESPDVLCIHTATNVHVGCYTLLSRFHPSWPPSCYL